MIDNYIDESIRKKEQPNVSEDHQSVEAAVGQLLLVEVSPQMLGDPPGWRRGEVWILFCPLS